MESIEPAFRLLGRYALYGKIASGGMATVRFGRLRGPAGFSRTVAIKCLYPQYAAEPEFVRMFLDEARLVARIRSPYVVPTLDVVTEDGELFIVMEYVPGESLAHLLRSGASGGVPVDVAVSVMCEVLEGLHAAHEARDEQGAPLDIVHRDVSPQNILLGTDGLAHVIDFGVAKAAGRLQTTREGQLKGKLAYMAPEQLRGEAVTRRSDVYSASVVLWEMLAGQRLFQAPDEGAMVTQVLMGKVVAPSSVAARSRDAQAARRVELLDALVLRGLSREPGARFASAREMAAALEERVTPASAGAASEWLGRVAADTIHRRAAEVAAMENDTADGPRAGQDGPRAGQDGPRAGQDEVTTAVDAPLPPSSQASSISVASNVRGVARRRWRAWAVLASMALAGLIASASHFLSRAGATAPASTWSSAGEASSAVAAGGPSPSSAASAAPTSTGSESTGSPAAPTALATASAPSTRPHASGGPARRRGSPAAGSRPPAAGCDPPFTWDVQGKKHYKPECL